MPQIELEIHGFLHHILHPSSQFSSLRVKRSHSLFVGSGGFDVTLVQFGYVCQTLQMGSHLPIPNIKSTHNSKKKDKDRHKKTQELTEATPWRDRAKASSIGMAPDILRSESLRMDEIAPVASSALESMEFPSPSASGRFLPKSSAIEGGGSAL